MWCVLPCVNMEKKSVCMCVLAKIFAFKYIKINLVN